MALKKNIYAKRFCVNLTLICVFVVEFRGILNLKRRK